MSSSEDSNNNSSSDKMSSPSKGSKEQANPSGPLSVLESPTPSPAANLPDSSTQDRTIVIQSPNLSSTIGTISLSGDPDCLQANTHKHGHFCTTCRGIPMPWGTDLPISQDDEGNVLFTGEYGSIMDGVALPDSEAIGVLSTVVEADVKGLPYSSIAGLIELMDRHPNSVRAGQYCAIIYQSIMRDARHEAPGVLPHYTDIVMAAMNEPTLRGPQYMRPIKEKLSTFGGHDSDREDSNSDERHDLDEEFWKNRPARTRNAAHAPGPKGGPKVWKFVEGSDLSDAVLGEPEPHKFFLVRQHKDDPNLIDVREYTGIAGHDWNSQACIDRLNKAMGQIKQRADPDRAIKYGPWTMLEKETLRMIIARIKDSSIMVVDWELVASELFDTLKDVRQEKDSKCAQTLSQNSKGVWKTPAKKDPKLSHDRLGAPNRNAGAVAAQAYKYPDVAELLKGMTELPRKNQKGKGKASGYVKLVPEDETPAKRRSSKKTPKQDAGLEDGADDDNSETTETSKKRASSGDDDDDESPLKKKLKEDELAKDSSNSKVIQSDTPAKADGKIKAAEGDQDVVMPDRNYLDILNKPMTMSRLPGQKPARERGKKKEKNDDKPSSTEPKDPPQAPPAAGTAA